MKTRHNFSTFVIATVSILLCRYSYVLGQTYSPVRVPERVTIYMLGMLVLLQPARGFFLTTNQRIMQQYRNTATLFPVAQLHQLNELLAQCPPAKAASFKSKKKGFHILVYFSSHGVSALNPDPAQALQLFREKLVRFNLIPA